MARGGGLKARCGEAAVGEGGQAARDRAKEKPVGHRGLTRDVGGIPGAHNCRSQVHSPLLARWSCAVFEKGDLPSLSLSCLICNGR